MLYAYALLPGLTATQTAAYASSPHFRIVENSTEVQAVTEETLGLVGRKFLDDVGSDGGRDLVRWDPQVVAIEAEGVLAVGVADPTQANSGGLRVGIDREAAEVLEKDEAVVVEQMTPSVVLRVDTRGARGRTLRVRLRLPRSKTLGTTSRNLWASAPPAVIVPPAPPKWSLDCRSV